MVHLKLSILFTSYKHILPRKHRRISRSWTEEPSETFSRLEGEKQGIRAIPCESWGSVLDQIHNCYELSHIHWLFKHSSFHRVRVPVMSTLVLGLLTKMQVLDWIISANSYAQLTIQLERSMCPPPVVSATCFGRNNKIGFVCVPVCIA